MRYRILFLLILTMVIVAGCADNKANTGETAVMSQENQTKGEKNLIEANQESSENLRQTPNEERPMEEEEPTLDETIEDPSLASTPADTYQPEMLVRSYGEMLVDAINSNDFSLIEKYLIKDSEFYKEQKQFVSDQYKQGTTFSLISLDVDDIVPGETDPDEYKVYVRAAYSIKSESGEKMKQTDQWIYTVLSKDTEFGISSRAVWRKEDSDEVKQ